MLFLLIYWVLTAGCSSKKKICQNCKKTTTTKTNLVKWEAVYARFSIHPSIHPLPLHCRDSGGYPSCHMAIKKNSDQYLKWLLMSGICLYTTLLTSHHTISVTLRSGLKVFACVLALLSCCMTCFHQGLTFDSRKWWDTEEFMVNSVTSRCPGPVANASIRVWVCV